MATSSTQLILGGNSKMSPQGVIVESFGEVVIGVQWSGRNPLLSARLYGSGGGLEATLVDNGWPFHEEPRFEVSANPSNIRLWDKMSGKTLFRANVTGPGVVVVDKLDIYDAAGTRYWTTTDLALDRPSGPLLNVESPTVGPLRFGATRMSTPGPLLTINATGVLF